MAVDVGENRGWDGRQLRVALKDCVYTINYTMVSGIMISNISPMN